MSSHKHSFGMNQRSISAYLDDHDEIEGIVVLQTIMQLTIDISLVMIPPQELSNVSLKDVTCTAGKQRAARPSIDQLNRQERQSRPPKSAQRETKVRFSDDPQPSQGKQPADNKPYSISPALLQSLFSCGVPTHYYCTLGIIDLRLGRSSHRLLPTLCSQKMNFQWAIVSQCPI